MYCKLIFTQNYYKKKYLLNIIQNIATLLKYANSSYDDSLPKIAFLSGILPNNYILSIWFLCNSLRLNIKFSNFPLYCSCINYIIS